MLPNNTKLQNLSFYITTLIMFKGPDLNIAP